jgi:hypothetical protein
MTQSIFSTGKDFFMPPLAPLMVLAFLGAAGATLLALLAALGAALARRPTLARSFGAGIVLIPAGYLAALLLLSARSSERLLHAGDEKYFCEADCHIAYSLDSVRVAKRLGPAGRPIEAAGAFHVVTLKAWFDERSISPHRGNRPLTPNPREVFVVDGSEQRYSPSAAAGRALAAAGVSSTPLDRPLAPGESYTTTLAFDVPRDAGGLRLLVADTESFTRVLIGHENSFFHKKIYFDLSGRATADTDGNWR